MRKRSLILLSLFLLLSAPACVRADEEDYDHVDESKGVVSSYDALNGGHVTADMLLLTADHALKMRLYDKAILLCQKALQLDPEDIDVHLQYATSLETKLRRQPKGQKDPNLFLATVREWLLVARSERGDEKGLTNAAGIGIPIINQRYQDEDRSIPAWQHIVTLVGFKPKATESDSKYLKRVEKAVSKSVEGQLVKGDDNKQPLMTTHTQPKSGPHPQPADTPQQKAESANARTF